jgi:hypothetical protein
MPVLDDASALIQRKTKVYVGGKLSEDHSLKDGDMKGLLKGDRKERLAATQKMEKSMQSAVEEMVTNGGGPSVSDALLDAVEAEMEALRKDLVDEHKNFQQQMDDASAAVEKCNTNMKSTEDDSVAEAKTGMGDRKTTHHTCREAEQSAYNEKESSCNLMVSESETTCEAAPSCIATRSFSATTLNLFWLVLMK